MKIVGVTSELAALFYDKEFLVALSMIDKSPSFTEERDDLFDYWLSWLEDADGQVAGWLVLASATFENTTTAVVKTIDNRKVTVTMSRFLYATRILGKMAYNLLIACPFLTTYRGEDSESYINNLLGWAAATECTNTPGMLNIFSQGVLVQWARARAVTVRSGVRTQHGI